MNSVHYVNIGVLCVSEYHLCTLSTKFCDTHNYIEKVPYLRDQYPQWIEAFQWYKIPPEMLEPEIRISINRGRRETIRRMFQLLDIQHC